MGGTALSQAQPLPLSSVPVPGQRPTPVASAVMGYQEPARPDAGAITGSILRPVDPGDRSGEASAALEKGLDAIDNDVARAIAIRDGMTRGSLDRQILTWAIAFSGQPGIPSHEVASAAATLEGWPGLSALRDHSERALHGENPPADEVLAAFGDSQPVTAEGAITLARALMAKGEHRRAHDIVARWWHREPMNTNKENLFLREFSGLLTVADHKRRMDMLLYHDRISQAERFYSKGEAHSLYVARAAVIAGRSDAAAKLKAVDGSWHDDPSYLHARIQYLRKQERYMDAAALLAQAPRDPAALVVPDAWWTEERIIARGLMESGHPREAYRIVANHSAESEVARVDAEFHAGWYALRALNDAAAAHRHFKSIVAMADQPLSLSRGYYWLGRTAAAGGPGRATDYYREAAAFQATYYGQLAAAELGDTSISVSYPSPSEAERQRFNSRRTAIAIKRLEDAGQTRLATKLYHALASALDSPGELALLSYMAESRGDYTTSLRVGKAAFYRGVDVAALAFPTGVIPSNANISGAGKALAYAIARQESEFNKAAVSPADARGLLQLLPGTARGVASRHGLAYAASRLTTDAAYNATLGAHYLGEQIADFGGSYILTFIAYNAGPRRVSEWIERFGDPRGKPIHEVVDWVERIPFPETRNYVQRVMENYQVYKARLGAQTDIVHDLRFGRT